MGQCPHPCILLSNGPLAASTLVRSGSEVLGGVQIGAIDSRAAGGQVFRSTALPPTNPQGQGHLRGLSLNSNLGRGGGGESLGNA